MILGNQDQDVSDHLKVFIKGQDDMVVALIGEGTSMEVVANWNSPFEGDSLASMFSKAEGVIQYKFGLTLLNSAASHQIWEGNQPYLFNLVLKFYALTDPVIEVEAAIQALEKMMAPDINEWLPGGRIPQTVQLNIGRKRLFNECVLTNLSQPWDKERDKDGTLVRCEVNLQVETIEMITQRYFQGE